MRPDLTWHRLSCGPGAKDHRDYDWAWISISSVEPGEHGLLLRRHRRTGELAFYRTYSPHPVALARLVTVAGTRWRIEESSSPARELTGLDQHQVRTWTPRPCQSRPRAPDPTRDRPPLHPSDHSGDPLPPTRTGLVTLATNDTKPEPAPPTTTVKPATTNDHDLRLEY